MGHTINPISQRLSLSFYWNSNWSILNKFNYINLFKKDYILFKYLDWLIKKKFFESCNFIISHYKIYRINNKIYINWFYYDSFSVLNIEYNLQKIPFFFLKKKKKLYYFQLHKIKQLKYFHFVLIFNLLWYNYFNHIIFFFKNLDNFKNIFFFNIYKINYDKFNSKGLGKFIAIKLRKRNQLNTIIKPILKDLQIRINLKNILGYKIVCSGRFTRKQRKVKLWYKNGKIKKNYFDNFTQYSLNTVRLKYGICGIKVWFNLGLNKKIIPLKYDLFNYNKIILYPFSFFKEKKILIIYLNFWLYIYNILNYKEYNIKNFKFYNYLLIYKYYITIKFFILINKYIINYKKKNFYFTIKIFSNLLLIKLNKKKLRNIIFNNFLNELIYKNKYNNNIYIYYKNFFNIFNWNKKKIFFLFKKITLKNDYYWNLNNNKIILKKKFIYFFYKKKINKNIFNNFYKKWILMKWYLLKWYWYNLKNIKYKLYLKKKIIK